MLLAHGSPEIELVAVTTVVGNQTLEKVTRNALSVGTGSPASPACRSPPAAPVRWCGPSRSPDIHGETGLDGPRLPEPTIEIWTRGTRST